jgi:hypothetical protein
MHWYELAMVKLIFVQLKQLEHLHSLTRVVPEQNGSLVTGHWFGYYLQSSFAVKKELKLPVAA